MSAFPHTCNYSEYITCYAKNPLHGSCWSGFFQQFQTESNHISIKAYFFDRMILRTNKKRPRRACSVVIFILINRPTRVLRCPSGKLNTYTAVARVLPVYIICSYLFESRRQRLFYRPFLCWTCGQDIRKGCSMGIHLNLNNYRENPFIQERWGMYVARVEREASKKTLFFISFISTSMFPNPR